MNVDEKDDDEELTNGEDDDLPSLPIPEALLRAAGIASDEDWDALPGAELSEPKP